LASFELADDSPAWALGFLPIPLDEIGLYDDEYRDLQESSTQLP
jgi:hypothetical protein